MLQTIAMAIACFLCYGFVFVFGFVSIRFVSVSIFVSVSVYVSVYDPLAERLMRLVLEELRPPSSWPNK